MALWALVTGAAGFIGRHMTAELLRHGYYVDKVDINRMEGMINQNNYRMDVRRFFASPNSMADKYDIVVHAAAHVGGREDIENMRTFIAAYNLQLDGALFEWALKAQPRHIVYMSSSAAYPVNMQIEGRLLPALREEYITLDNPLKPDMTYGWTKVMGEITAHYYLKDAMSFNGRVHVVRPFSGYGSDQDATYPFGAFIDRALNKEDPFTVWGNGKQIRDFIHVDDICIAIMRMISNDMGGPMNLCTGIGISMVDLAATVCEIAGYNAEIHVQHDKPTGVFRRIGNPKLMMELLPKTITIEEGISRALMER
jgi:nucleoside-diphosphate-sugar epimerase